MDTEPLHLNHSVLLGVNGPGEPVLTEDVNVYGIMCAREVKPWRVSGVSHRSRRFLCLGEDDDDDGQSASSGPGPAALSKTKLLTQ